MIRPGDPAWLDGERVRVRCVLMGRAPYTAVLWDGRRVPVDALTSASDVARMTSGVGW